MNFKKAEHDGHNGKEKDCFKVEFCPTGAVFKLGTGLLRVDFITDHIARVRATNSTDWSMKPSLMRVDIEEKPGEIKIQNDGEIVEMHSSKLVVRVDRSTGAVSYFTPSGHLLLMENPVMPRTLEKTDVIKSVADPATIKKVKTVDGEREVADKYLQVKDRDAWKGRVCFLFNDDEALYGLGFDETTDLNLRGTTKRLYQHNLRILIPSLVSTRGYGLLFDAYSAMTFTDDVQGCSMSFDVIDELDYYFIAGTNMDGAVAGYRQLTGAATMLPRWAFGYVQSKERYKSQEELVATAKEFRDRNIPIDTIVQDWNYWPQGQWGSLEMDPKFYPDPSAMAQAIHAMNIHVMLSIWPNPDKMSDGGRTFKKHGYTLGDTSFVNMFDPNAREMYWRIVWENLGRHGIDAWWCDSTEPDMGDWNYTTRPGDADLININRLAFLMDPQLLNAYGLEDAKGIYENMRKSVPDKRVLNLTRSGYAGSQRTGAMLWTGDTAAKWSQLEHSVVAMLSISAAGYPYITDDTGAFFIKRGTQWFWTGEYDKGVDDLAYRELYTRWLQFSTFLPMFRSHGTDTPREPWHFGEPGTPFYDAILACIHLRYRLLPYFYSQAGAVHQRNASFLRPLSFLFPEDKETHDLKNQMLVGDALMVCPVLAPMYYQTDSIPIQNAPKIRAVYLPMGTTWIDFWTGQPHPGGQTIQAEAPLDHSPLFVKAGGIVPMGPQIQHVGEKNDAPIELRIYPGADGTYTFYEDAGEGWGYEQGEFTNIPIHWNDSNRQLTIGHRQGSFPGMAKERFFHIILVSPGNGMGLNSTTDITEIFYTGQTLEKQILDKVMVK